MKIEINPIETERLLLRKWTEKDAPFYLEYIRQKEGYKFSSIAANPEKTLEQFLQSFQKFLNGQYPCWAVILKSENKAIGTVGIQDIFPLHDICELGWRLNVDYWGKGYTTEAVRAIIDYIFNTTTINRIEALNIHVDNIASHRVCEKLGFKKEGVAREIRKAKTGYYDAVNYAILRSDWE